MRIKTGQIVTSSRSANAEPAGDLATALTTLTIFHDAVQHADDKARSVVAFQTMLTATIAAQLAFFSEPGAARFAQLVILAVFLLGFLQSSCYLLRALTPRTTPPRGHNQFAFPSVAAVDFAPVRWSVREQCVQAYAVGHVLARLAMVKHRHIRRAMYGTYALFTSALGSLVLTVVS